MIVMVMDVNGDLFLVLQVIPSMLPQPVKAKENKHDVFAYVSVENLVEPENPKLKRKRVKISRGQIMKCNLTESHMAGGLILGQV